MDFVLHNQIPIKQEVKKLQQNTKRVRHNDYKITKCARTCTHSREYIGFHGNLFVQAYKYSQILYKRTYAYIKCVYTYTYMFWMCVRETMYYGHSKITSNKLLENCSI